MFVRDRMILGLDGMVLAGKWNSGESTAGRKIELMKRESREKKNLVCLSAPLCALDYFVYFIILSFI